MIDITQISLTDKRTWDLICAGHTKGVFQLETHLGKHWCKEAKPRNIEELADVISVIRPGTLKAIEEGKSMTQRYVDRKHNVEPVKSLYEPIDKVIASTYNIIIYQEQAMQIAQVMAGFTESQADTLRKAIGKKKADLMRQVKGEFIEGCLSQGHTQENADRIFDIIEKSNRYSFNKSACPETTYVEKRDGTSCKMKDVEIGEEVKTPNGYATVKDKMDHGVLDLFEIELDNGKTIRCTINHKFLCTTGEILPLWQIISLGKEIVSE